MLASDAYLLPGKQFFPVEFPHEDAAKTGSSHVHANIATYLAAEVTRGDFAEGVDSRRLASILKAFSNLTGCAKNIDRRILFAAGLGGPLRTLMDCDRPEISKACLDLLKIYGVGGGVKPTRST